MAIDPRAQTFLTALRAGNARAAEHIVRRQLEAGAEPASVQVEILAPRCARSATCGRATSSAWPRSTSRARSPIA